ncbi:MAG: alpha/beta fold hydrolase [Pseudomonadota bacterium]
MVKLTITEFGGDGPGVPLVLLHGLLGTARNLAVVARAFVGMRRVIGLDMRNHGSSPWSESHSYTELAEDVAETLKGKVHDYDLLGHSMGGKAAMVGTASGILTPRKLVIGDIAPVAYAHTQAPAIEAMLEIDLNSFDRRAPLANALGKNLGNPVMGQFLAQAAVFDTPDKDPYWSHNLHVLLARMEDLVGYPDGVPVSDQDVLFVAGGASDYVQPDAVTQAFPKAQIATIDGAGHWVHAENPKAFNALVADYLN